MLDRDIVIVGAGLAGAICATVLVNAGHSVSIIDPHAVYPNDFRCEKLGGQQVELLRQLGLDYVLDDVATSFSGEWIARYGRLVEARPATQYGIDYGAFVNAVRDRMPEAVDFVRAKVIGVEPSADRQTVRLSNGVVLTARLVIIANGLNSGLRHTLGMPRHDISPCHSISIGFDVVSATQKPLPFPALTYHSESPDDRTAYLTLFPIADRMRANLFLYRSLDDPWLRSFKSNPAGTLCETLPELRALTGNFAVTGAVKIRPIDLYETENVIADGVVLVGDAVRTACPAAGTGVIKLLTDVDRLCTIYAPQWLATPGMGADKIAQYYRDPERQASDRKSTAKAYFAKSLTLDDTPAWQARRFARYAAGRVTGGYASAHASLQPIAAQIAAFLMI